jgi:hypothetical protein
MNEESLKLIEGEVLGWAGVFKKRDEDGPGGVGVTVYGLGHKQIGHVHNDGHTDGHTDLRFPKEVRDDLIRCGQALSHPARSRTAGRRRATRYEARKTFLEPWNFSA